MTDIENRINEYSEYIEEIKDKIKKLKFASGNQVQVIERNAWNAIDDAEKITRELFAMQNESHRFSATERANLSRVVKVNVSEIKQLRADLSSIIEEKSKQDLFMKSGDDYYQRQTDVQRDRILESTQKLERTSERLDSTYAAARESEEIGVAVIADLNVQRTKLGGAIQKSENVDTNMGKASTILRNMGRRAITDTLIQVIIVILLVLVIVGIVFYKWLIPLFV